MIEETDTVLVQTIGYRRLDRASADDNKEANCLAAEACVISSKIVGTVIKDMISLVFSILKTKDPFPITSDGGKQTVLPTDRASEGARTPKPFRLISAQG